MHRRSLTEYLEVYPQRGGEIAIAQRRGYRMVRWSYARVAETAAQFARELEARGIAKGDCVVLWGQDSAQWVIAFLGCVLRGAIVVPMDRIAAPEFARRVARQVGAKLVVASRQAPGLGPEIPALPLESLSETIAERSCAPYAPAELSRADAAEIVFTSGTTAEPRGVVISHGNILANLEPFETEIPKYLRYERFFHPVRFLNLLPLSHVFGQMLGIFLPPLLGGTVIFLDTLSPAGIVRTIHTERVSVLVAVPRLLESLRDKIERDTEAAGRLARFRADFAASEGEHFLKRWWRFRRIHRQFGWKFWALVSGGAALPAELEAFWSRLGYAVIQGYGMTETASLISVNHPFHPGKGSIGKVLPGIELRLDERGEILVRGESVAAGYWQSRQLEPVSSGDGWFHTGDLGERDEQGNLYFKGRRKNVIVTREGMNVHPEDLEAALRSEHVVRDCVVLGIEREGNAEPCAVLLLRDQSHDPREIVERANRSLASYQRIGRWIVWPEQDFPRTPTQKPRLSEIRAFVESELGKEASASAAKGPVAEWMARTARVSTRLSGDFHLETDLNLSSVDRVELLAALEERYQVELNEQKFAEAATVGEIERLVQSWGKQAKRFAYPRWPQRWPCTWIRMAVYYLLVWPATYVLAAPRIRGRERLRGVRGPVLVASNHITMVDIGYILAALPLRLRHRLAIAMEGERLREMQHPPAEKNIFARAIERMKYALLVLLFNVFPLPQQSGFRESFAFAGDSADRGFSVLVFPEGHRTHDGRMAPFRAGVGLLAARLGLPVVPMRIDGLFELKQANAKFAWPGRVRVSIGDPVRFAAEAEADKIARDVEARVRSLGNPDEAESF
jgi:long-chain acyl-CoA synthetase